MQPQPKADITRIPHGSAKYKALQADVLERDGHRCLICTEHTKAPPHHIVPLSAGGSDIKENMATLCADCHYEMHHRSLFELLDKLVNVSPGRVLRYYLLGRVSCQ